jgi:hypothetical protein
VNVVEVHDHEFVRVHVPRAVERSLHLALAGVHAPFFTLHEKETVVVILQREEWDRLAPRFASARVSEGFRLVSLHPPHLDGTFASRLTAALSAAGLSARLLPSFHNDHLLVPTRELDRTVEAVRPLLAQELRP